MKTTRGRIVTGWRHAVPPKSPSFRRSAPKTTSSGPQPLMAQAAEANLVKVKA